MVYVSLGSNMGDRMMYLQLAVGLIEYRVGKIKKLAPVVETPAWGFESSPFLNTCLALETNYTPTEVLDHLLAIETFLGRNRAIQEGYQARTIDLDILFFGAKKVNSPRLTLPHPRLELRQFVLTPLAAIAPDFIHPVLNQSIKTLATNCPDATQAKIHAAHLALPEKKKFIAIEGNIGAGKTSFAHTLNQALTGSLLLENFQENPYLEKFYEDPKQYALLVEKTFLEERIQQYHTFFTSSPTPPVVSDYHLHKSLLFAKQNLSVQDFKDYQSLYLTQANNCATPDLVIFLNQSVVQLQENIQKRGRSYEQTIAATYLDKIATAYEEWKQKSESTIVVLDLKDVDFIQHPEHFLPLLAHLFCA